MVAAAAAALLRARTISVEDMRAHQQYGKRGDVLFIIYDLFGKYTRY